MTKTKPQLPDYINADFGRELIAYLGGDPAPVEDNWCWEDFAYQYPELLPAAQQFIESATTGDPAWWAYMLARRCGAPVEWAMRVIESATTGGPAEAADQLALYCRAPLDWAANICRKHGNDYLAEKLEANNDG